MYYQLCHLILSHTWRCEQGLKNPTVDSKILFVFKQRDLPKLDIDRGIDFKAWKSQWKEYISLSDLDSQLNAKQVQALTWCFSRETVTIVNNMGLTAAQQEKTTKIIVAIERYAQRHQ